MHDKHDEAVSTGPVDLSALQSDDVLVDVVVRASREEGAEELFGLDTDAEQHRLVAMLLAWRREIDSRPIPELVSVERASAVLASRPERRRPARLVPLAGAAAVLLIVCFGLALTARSAMPSSPLWGVSKVLYSQRAESVQAAVTATKKFDDTRAALASGHIDQARTALADASNALASVRPEEGRQDLTVQHDVLINELQRSALPEQAAGSLPTVGQPQGSLPQRGTPQPAPPQLSPSQPAPPQAAPPQPALPQPSPSQPAPPKPSPPQPDPSQLDPSHHDSPRRSPHHRPPPHGPPSHRPTSRPFTP